MAGDGAAGASVLVVEDDAVLLGVITALFERSGLQVRIATSGEEALGLLRAHGAGIDWLFTDIELPGTIDGWMVADEYRLSHPFRPVIYASTKSKRAGRDVHGSIFVQKPVQPDEILRISEMMRSNALAAGS